MNFLSSIASLAGSVGICGNSGMMALLPALMEQVEKYPGGLAGLVEAFQKGGLGEVVSSWISNGPNLPVTGDQLLGVLGAPAIDELAKASDRSNGEVLELLTRILPKAIDKLTPDGELPKDGAISMSSLLGLLGEMKSGS